MPISHRIRRTKAVEVIDHLGGDPVERGELRIDAYPAVEVEFYDTDTDTVINAATYVLRPRSAIETLDDVKVRVAEHITDLEGKAQPAPFDPDADIIPVLKPADQTFADKVELSAGKTLDEAIADVTVKGA